MERRVQMLGLGASDQTIIEHPHFISNTELNNLPTLNISQKLRGSYKDLIKNYWKEAKNHKKSSWTLKINAFIF